MSERGGPRALPWRRPRPLSPQVATRFVVIGVMLTLIHSFRLAAGASAAALSVLTLLAIGALLVGIRHNRPQPAGPWWLVVASAVLFTVGAALREQTGSTGDLTASRALIPDAFTFPGYLLFSIALLWLLNVRRRENHQPGIRLDATILATASLVMVWALLLSPTFERRDAELVAIVAVSMYPPISVFLVAIATRLAFEPGPRNVGHRMLLAGMVTLLIGDLTYFLVDSHVIDLPGRMVDLPYGLTYALIAGATLHPSIRTVFQPPRARQRPIGARERLGLVALALFVPSLLLLLWRPGNQVERLLVPILTLILAGLAVARTIVALREQTRSEARLAYQATHDALTGLPNRTFVLDALGEHLAPGGRGAGLAYLDIDRFKLVNDSLGHDAGDRLLQIIADRLCERARPGDVVARISGDEFCILSPGATGDEIAELAARICGVFARPLDIGTDVHLTASIGYVHAEAGPDCAPTALLRDADTAMYRSKDRGGNAITGFDPSMYERVARRHSLEANLRRVLDNDGLEVHYQPIVDLTRPGEPVEGFEALARWHHRGSWISPAEFVAIAEESGLIDDLGRFVLRTACGHLAELRRIPGNESLSVSVNVSPQQFRHGDLAREVTDALADAGLPGNALWVEVTESSEMLYADGIIETLSELRRLGVRVCIDDFGTGFSSLSYLERFPVDRLKIDRRFVDRLVDVGRRRSLIEAILAIAASLDLDVVAEGVETPLQLDRLRQAGCRGAQGYLFGRPAPLSSLPEFRRRVAPPADAPAAPGSTGSWVSSGSRTST